MEGQVHTGAVGNDQPVVPMANPATSFEVNSSASTIETAGRVRRGVLIEDIRMNYQNASGNPVDVFLPEESPWATRPQLEAAVFQMPYKQAGFEEQLKRREFSVDERAMGYYREQLRRYFDFQGNNYGKEDVATKGVFPLVQEENGTVWLAVNINHPGSEVPREAGEISNIPDELKNTAILKYAPEIKMLLLTPLEYRELTELATKPDALRAKLRVINPLTQARDAFSTLLDVALDWKASDIHIEPKGSSGYQLRYRIDGSLVPALELTTKQAQEVISIIKLKAEMNIAEHRRSQDGAINFKDDPHYAGINLRVSVLLAKVGAGESRESVVMRVLNSNKDSQLSLDKMGYGQDQVQVLNRVIQEPQGIIIVTGPTGSGKTTLLYSVLRSLHKPDTKCITIEDPVEQALEGLTQVEVDEAIGNTWSDVFRRVLRQDPDVILVGEIRDPEVASTACAAANTGHLVLTTLHANSALEAAPRLEDLKIRGTAFQSIKAIVAQRLVRNLCGDCVEPYDGRAQLNELLGEPLIEAPVTLYRPRNEGRGFASCTCCHGVGLRGRRAVGEVWSLTADDHEDLRRNEFNLETFYDRAVRSGNLKPMLYAGLEAVFAGKTSLDELVGAVGSQEFAARRKTIAHFVRDWFGHAKPGASAPEH